MDDIKDLVHENYPFSVQNGVHGKPVFDREFQQHLVKCVVSQVIADEAKKGGAHIQKVVNKAATLGMLADHAMQEYERHGLQSFLERQQSKSASYTLGDEE